MLFDESAWEFAGKVIQSAGYESCVEFLERTLPKEWQNGLAAHITHKGGTDRADLAPIIPMKPPTVHPVYCVGCGLWHPSGPCPTPSVEYRDGTVEEIK